MSQEDVLPAKEQKSHEVVDAVVPPSASIEVPQTHEDEPFPSKTSPHGEDLVRTPVVSVAHKATKGLAAPAPKLDSVYEPDQDISQEKREDSIHARPHRRQYQNQVPATMTPREGTSPMRMADGKKHDPMEYFDTKQKEYYHPASPKAKALQSKDRNAPLKSIKLNPEAKVYAREAIVEPVTAAAEPQVPSTTMCQDNHHVDLTPMLNVLGARTKTPGVPPTTTMDSVLELLLEKGATQSVGVENVNMELNMRMLQELAAGVPPTRDVTGITDSFRNGVRMVVFGFTNIPDAVGFRSSLRRNVDWEGKEIDFVRDA